ncbi:MAG: hypothetical protein OXH76_03915 [Boseongicola sp.]|nr:hypothetical protein [Boseongicola sp.]
MAQQTVQKLVPNGVEILIPFIYGGGGGMLNLGLDGVATLLHDKATPSERDHFISVYLATIESCLYRHGHCSTGHIIRIQAGNYRVAPNEEKQAIIRDGFPFRVGTVSSAEELAALTPLKRVTDAEYSAKFEELHTAWGSPSQKAMIPMMDSRLATTHELMPQHKIGKEFHRERQTPKGPRNEPVPLYVRNEISHPNTPDLPESATFQQDKSIGYAMMEAWLAQGSSA